MKTLFARLDLSIIFIPKFLKEPNKGSWEENILFKLSVANPSAWLSNLRHSWYLFKIFIEEKSSPRSLAQEMTSTSAAISRNPAFKPWPAGQGLNAGFRDIAALVDVISCARERGEDFSSINILNRYQEWRRFDNQALGFATDNLNKIFSSHDPLFGSLRNLGMKMIDKSNRAKRVFIKQAAGLNGDLPKLMR